MTTKTRAVCIAVYSLCCLLLYSQCRICQIDEQGIGTRKARKRRKTRKRASAELPIPFAFFVPFALFAFRSPDHGRISGLGRPATLLSLRVRTRAKVPASEAWRHSLLCTVEIASAEVPGGEYTASQ